MTNYYNSLGGRMDTNPKKMKIATRYWQFVLMLVFSLFLGQLSFAQVSGYVFAESTETYAQITGTNSTATGDDAAQSNIAIGFPFTFGTIAYSNFGISTNGFIKLNNGAVTTAAAAFNSIANSGTNRPLIAAFWDDNNRSTGSISYSVTGTTPNRVLSVNWHNVKIGGGGSTLGTSVSAIIRLYETTNVIEIVYGTPFTTTNTLSASVGLNDATSFLSVTPAAASTVSSATANNAINAATIANLAGKKLTFTPPPPPACPAPAGVTVTQLSATTASVSWTGAAAAVVEWGTTGCVAGSGATAGACGSVVSGSSPQMITGLTLGTIYSVNVRQDCTASSNGYSTNTSATLSNSEGESCATASTITVASNLATSVNTLLTTGLTADGPAGTCSDATGNPNKKDRWVSFVAPTSGNKIIVTTSSGTITDAVMQVWSACPASGTALGCSDDVVGLMPELDFCTYTPGATYYVQVWPYSATATGNFNIKIYEDVACAVPPSNDECAGVVTLAVQTSGSFPADAITGTTVNATATPGVVKTTCDAFGTYQDVFYKFNTGLSTEVQFAFSSLTGTCEFGLYSDCGLTFAGICNSTATVATPYNTIITGLTANTDYYVVVWSNSVATQGTFNIRVAALAAPLCVTAPTAPLDGGTSCANVTLDWPVVVGATSYDVFVDGLLVSDNLNANTTSFNTTLSAGAHTWSVVPANSAGEATGCATFTFTSTAAPVGDTFATAIDLGALAGNSITTGNNLAANCYSNDFTTVSTPGDIDATTGRDVFYKFTVSDVCNTISIGTCTSSFDTYLHVLDATGVSIAGDDDSCVTPNSLGSLVNLTNLLPGDYYAVVEGFGTNEGTYTLDITYSGTPLITYYADTDGDGFGNAAVSQVACTAPVGYVTNNTDCLDTNATANPGALEVPFDGVDNNCDGQIDEGSVLTTSLRAPFCNITTASMNSFLFFNAAPNATKYRVRATNSVTNFASTFETTNLYFKMRDLPSYEFGTTYNVDVMVERLGVWLNYYGDACPVTTNALPTLTVGTGCVTNIVNRFSGITTTNVAGVSQYKFRVTRNVAGATAQEYTSNWNGILMHYIGGFVYGSSYNVEVATKASSTSVFSDYSSPCVINTPAVPTLAAGSCDATVTGNFQGIYTTNLGNNATGYRFEFTSLAGVVTLDTTLYWFYPTAIPGYVAGTNYSVRVAVKNGADVSEYGEACELNPVAPSRFGQAGSPTTSGTDFKAVGYPNPFATNFTLNVTTTSDEKVQVVVYDMIGKQLESKEVNAADVNALEVGANYPAGVYNVIVSQGANVTSLRMIKR
jgi:Putative metal-binding motif/Secretion system C-terminal sorting domain